MVRQRRGERDPDLATAMTWMDSSDEEDDKKKTAVALSSQIPAARRETSRQAPTTTPLIARTDLPAISQNPLPDASRQGWADTSELGLSRRRDATPLAPITNNQPRRRDPRSDGSTTRWIEPQLSTNTLQPQLWPKFGLVSMANGVNHVEKDDQKAHTSAILKGALPILETAASAFYLWSHEDVSPYDLLGANLGELHDIMIRHRVFIDWMPELRSIRVRVPTAEWEHFSSASNTDLKQIIQAVIDKVTAALMESEVSGPNFFVEAPSTYHNDDVVTYTHLPISKETTNFRIGPPKHDGTQPRKSDWAAVRGVLANKQRNDLLAALRAALISSKTVAGRMVLRLHLGRIVMTKLKKDFFDRPYSSAEFRKMLYTRAKGYLKDEIHGSAIANKLISFLQSDGQNPIVQLTYTSEQKQLSMLIAAGGDLTARADASLSAMGRGGNTRYNAGIPLFYQEDTRQIRFEANVLSLDSDLNWSLRLKSRKAWQHVPKAWKATVESCARRLSMHEDNSVHLNTANVDFANVLSITVRSTTTYRIDEASEDQDYFMEISMLHTWAPADNFVTPNVNLTINVYNSAWDEDLADFSDSEHSRIYTSDLGQVVDRTLAKESFLMNIFDRVDVIRRFLESAVLR